MHRAARAPGRVNLIGEHTDYNEGLVLPMAIGLECRVVAEPSDRWLATSRQMGETAPIDRTQPGHWSHYLAGIAAEFGARGKPLHLTIDSQVPTGGGLSSSASLEVAAALAIAGEIDPLELVARTNKVEREFVGLPCGVMDQYASVFGREGHAVLLDCRTVTSEYVPLPDVAVIAVNTMVKHELAGSAYRDRVRECREAAESLGVASLRDATETPSMPPRARHVVSEIRRVREFAAACRAGDLAAMGRLMLESHASLRECYEVSCPELDFLVAESAGFPRVWGARLTGGGFGGCIVALVERGVESAYEMHIQSSYTARFGRTPDIFRLEAAPGAGLISNPGGGISSE
jgi:galactokinase